MRRSDRERTQQKSNRLFPLRRRCLILPAHTSSLSISLSLSLHFLRIYFAEPWLPADLWLYPSLSARRERANPSHGPVLREESFFGTNPAPENSIPLC